MPVLLHTRRWPLNTTCVTTKEIKPAQTIITILQSTTTPAQQKRNYSTLMALKFIALRRKKHILQAVYLIQQAQSLQSTLAQTNHITVELS